jgi:hypothetical protein
MMATSQALGDIDVQNSADIQNVSIDDYAALFHPVNSVDFATVSGGMYCSSSHNATDTPQFIAAAHPENRDSQYWTAHDIYTDLTKIARRQHVVVISQMIGAELDREQGTLTCNGHSLPPTGTGGDHLPMGSVDEVSELSSTSEHMPSEHMPSLDKVRKYLSLQCWRGVTYLQRRLWVANPPPYKLLKFFPSKGCT